MVARTKEYREPEVCWNSRCCCQGICVFLYLVDKGTKKSQNVQGKAEKLSLFRQMKDKKNPPTRRVQEDLK